MATEIGIGLIGYGSIGRVHALCYRMLPLCYPALTLQPRIAAVAVASEASAERVRRELGDVDVTTDVAELIGWPSVALVDCCAPTGDHAHIARSVLDAGKPLFCEKPLAVESSTSFGLAQLAEQQQLVCGVNYHFRSIPALQEARRWIESGALGEVVSFNMRYQRSSNLRRDRPINWRFQGPGSGVLVDLGAHLIDQVFDLLGPIASVSARTRTLIDERPGQNGAAAHVASDDAAWLSVELTNGAFGTIHASKVAPGAADDLRIEAYGSRGTLIFDTADPNRILLADQNGQRELAVFSKVVADQLYPSSEQTTAPLIWHLASIAAYLQALGGGEPFAPTLGDAARVDQVIEAALRSASDGGTLVRLG